MANIGMSAPDWAPRAGKKPGRSIPADAPRIRDRIQAYPRMSATVNAARGILISLLAWASCSRPAPGGDSIAYRQNYDRLDRRMDAEPRGGRFLASAH